MKNSLPNNNNVSVDFKPNSISSKLSSIKSSNIISEKVNRVVDTYNNSKPYKTYIIIFVLLNK